MSAYGLQTQIWNNNLKSILLLAGFPILLLMVTFALCMLLVGASASFDSPQEGVAAAFEQFAQVWPFAILAALVWFAIAWAINTQVIKASVGAKGLSRKEAPEIYNLLENLCISRGMTMPRLNVIESPALNAFASGVDERSYTVTLTRGLIERLDREELEAVIAHELTHIRNRDVRLLIVAVIFVGIFSFLGEMIYRSVFHTGVRIGGHTRSRNGDSRGGGILIVAALAAIAAAYVLALVIRFALSQKREYLADAGAVDLTRNADGMISALQKISGNSALEAPADVRQMMVHNATPFAGVFATHPPIEKRIAALSGYGA